MSAKPHASGHTSKHVSSRKHSGTSKHRPNHHKKPVTHHHQGHKVTVKGTHPHHAKAVGFGVGDWLPVCAFEAVAMSLRLLGQPVHDDDVCELWHLLGEPDEGVSVGEALAAAALFGLAGFRPVAVAEGAQGACVPALKRAVLTVRAFPALLESPINSGDQPEATVRHLRPPQSLILRVDVPGPHAVLATPGGWWSWGELCDPWPCHVSEAWTVSWA